MSDIATSVSDVLTPTKVAFLQEWLENLPRHHKKRPHLICNALMRANNLAPHLEDLAYSLLPALPRMVETSQSLKSITIRHVGGALNLSAAIDQPWISFSTPAYTNAITLDIDHGHALEIWKSLPEQIRPHLVYDPQSLTCHAIFRLKTPVHRYHGAKLGPQFLLERATELLAHKFKASRMAPTAYVKNPWGIGSNIVGVLKSKACTNPDQAYFFADHREEMQARGASPDLLWHTVPGADAIELMDVLIELQDEDDLETGTKKERVFRNPRTAEDNPLGRNCTLFDRVRFQAYAHYITDDLELFRLALAVNNEFADPLPPAEVHDTACSIGKFMRGRYRGRARYRPMQLSPAIPLAIRQKKGADRTNKARSDRIDNILLATLDAWDRSEPITQKSLSEKSGVSLKSVKRRWAWVVKTYDIKDKKIRKMKTHEPTSIQDKNKPLNNGKTIRKIRTRRGSHGINSHSPTPL